MKPAKERATAPARRLPVLESLGREEDVWFVLVCDGGVGVTMPEAAAMVGPTAVVAAASAGRWRAAFSRMVLRVVK